MNKKLLILAVVAVAICFVIGSIDAPPPDVSAFTRTTAEPADEDNAYCGFVAATNAVRRMPEAVQWEKLSPEETDAIVAENAEALALFQNAMRRTKWYDKSARNASGLCLPPVSDFAKMMKLYKAKVSRQIERGEIAAAVDGVHDFLSLSRTMLSGAESIVSWYLADALPTDPFDHGAALKYDVERDIVWTVGPDRDFTGDIQSGKKSYGRNRKYVVNLDGSEAK